MAWQISQRDGKYRLWSTISDQWLTDWVNRDEALIYYFTEALFEFKLEFIKKHLLFPHFSADHDNTGKVITDYERNDAYCEWNRMVLKAFKSENPQATYSTLIEGKFQEILETLGVEMGTPMTEGNT